MAHPYLPLQTTRCGGKKGGRIYGVFCGLIGATGGMTGAGDHSHALGKIKGVNPEKSISYLLFTVNTFKTLSG
jgi:hypothetical protein